MKKREMQAEIDRLHEENQRLQVELYVERVRQPVVWTIPAIQNPWPPYTITCGASRSVQFALGG